MLKLKKYPKEKGQIDISITRADSAYLNFDITDINGNFVAVDGTDAIVKVQVRKQAADDGDLVFNGTIIYNDDKTATWHIVPSDTDGLPYATYYYDAEVEYSNGDTFTFIPFSKFTITSESTKRVVTTNG